MKTAIVLRRTIVSKFSDLPKKPKDLFSGNEIDRMDPEQFSSLSQEELMEMKRRLMDTQEWLESPDERLGTMAWKIWDARLDRLNDLMDEIDKLMEREEEEGNSEDSD